MKEEEGEGREMGERGERERAGESRKRMERWRRLAK